MLLWGNDRLGPLTPQHIRTCHSGRLIMQGQSAGYAHAHALLQRWAGKIVWSVRIMDPSGPGPDGSGKPAPNPSPCPVKPRRGKEGIPENRRVLTVGMGTDFKTCPSLRLPPLSQTAVAPQVLFTRCPKGFQTWTSRRNKPHCAGSKLL